MDRRSKIYTYFYGRNTVLQQFIILMGAFIVAMSMMWGVAIDGDLGTFITVLGVLEILVGVVWILYKKFSFKKK